MRSLLLLLVLAPELAEAGRHDGPTVRDHRRDRDRDTPTVRDHRRDRDNDRPAPVVRDHRRSSNDDDDSDFFTSTTEVDTTPSDPFANPVGPTWMLELGGFAHRFRGPAFDRSGSVETIDGSMAGYDLASGTPTAGDTAGGAFQMRFIVPASEHTYAGVELGIGGLTRTPITLMADSDIHIASKTMVGTNGVVGARARQGIAELNAEVAGGMRLVSMNIQSYGAGEEDPSASEYSATGIVEARLRGLLWVSPHFFVAAQAGVGVLERDDVNFGLSIGLASRAYGQMR